MSNGFIKMAGMLALLVLSISGCASAEHQSWDFIQKVGGLTVVGQDKNPSWLIIHGDISGLKEFSVKPTLLNSALAIKSVEAIVRDTKIQIYVVTTPASKMYPDTEIRGVGISGIKKGTYMVQYQNPDNSTIDLKEVTIY